MESSNNKIRVEIWTDIVCPFCYIGKRNFEKALEDFSDTASVEITWRSFILDPNTPAVSDNDLHQHLIERKDITPEQAQAMTRKVSQLAKQAGLEFNLEKVKVANSRPAHKLLHFAASKGKGNEVMELLFKAYFTEGKNIADPETLISIALASSLDEQQTKEMLQNSNFNHAIEKDIYEAQLVDVRGVPFFLFNGEMAVPGALPVDTFKSVLQKILAKPIGD